jgi:hypothetical protein
MIRRSSADRFASAKHVKNLQDHPVAIVHSVPVAEALVAEAKVATGTAIVHSDVVQVKATLHKKKITPTAKTPKM